MGQHTGWPDPPEIGSRWTIECGPFRTGYYVMDVLPNGTVIMEDEDHEVRIIDHPDGSTEVKELTKGEWVTVD